MIYVTRMVYAGKREIIEKINVEDMSGFFFINNI